MSSERFSWSRVDNITGAFELRKRNFKRKLMKDSSLRCWVKACRSPLSEGDTVYYPSEFPGPDNKVMGHAACVDRLCAEHTAKSAAEAARASEEARNLITLPETSKRAGSSKQKPQVAAMRKLNDHADPLEQIERLKQEIYNQGYKDGIAAALAKLTGAKSAKGSRHA